MTKTTDTAIPALLLGEAGSAPIEDRLRETVRTTIEAVFEEELAAFLGPLRTIWRIYGSKSGPRRAGQAASIAPSFVSETLVSACAEALY